MGDHDGLESVITIGWNTHVRACRPVEHPCWNFQAAICLQPIKRAAEGDIISLLDPSMNANSATEPGMMSIKNLAKNGPVGVLEPLLYNTVRPHSAVGNLVRSIYAALSAFQDATGSTLRYAEG